MDAPYFVYPFAYWRKFWLLSSFDNYEQSCCKCSCSGFCPHLSFLFFFPVFYFFNFKIFNSYMCSETWTPSHLPPHNISVGHPHAPAPSTLYPASDIDWRFNSYMIVYMLECHSPKSSHPLPLPLSPKVHYAHLCLFSCLAYRVVIAIFLNSIYMR